MCVLGGKGSLQRGWQEGGAAGDKGQAACPWLGADAECVLCKAAEVLG